MKNKKYDLVTDIDTILYRAAMGIQKNFITVEWKNNGRRKQFKNITEFRGSSKTSIGGWLGDINTERKEKGYSPFLLKDFTIEKCSQIISNDKNAKNYLTERITEMMLLPWVNSLKLIVGGTNNFRYDIYTEYKANREKKPIRFKEIKEWFCKEFKDIVTVADGCEADDYLNMLSWDDWNKYGEDSLFCSGYIDKDCDQSPGNKWNYDKNKLYFINEFEAHYNLCIQTLIGDKYVDNIPGIPSVNNCIQEIFPIALGGFGKVKANKVLSECKTIQELYDMVEFIYKCYYNDEYKEPLNLTYRLVKLLEKPNEIKDFPFKD